MDDKTRDAVKAVVDYLYDDECKDFKSSGEPEDHIFRHVRRLQLFLDPGYEANIEAD